LVFMLGEIQAQKEDYIWLMGGGHMAGWDTTTAYSGIFQMDFNMEPVQWSQIYPDMAFSETKASICNAEGKLVCYTNGVKVMNGNHEVLVNGDDFQPSQPEGYFLQQGALILPYPEHENQYILFTGDAFFGQLQGMTPLYYSLLNMDFNNGQGRVEEKKTTLLQDTLTWGNITACRHANGRDWWLLVTKQFSNKFYRFLISPEKIELIGSQVVGDSIYEDLGQAKFSPDGAWYANSFTGLGTSLDTELHLFQFDRCTGLLIAVDSDQYTSTIIGGFGGLAFSANSQFMYNVVGRDSIFQYNLEANDIFASRTLVAELATFIDTIPGLGITYQPNFANMQLAPDGKIYVVTTSAGNNRRIHIIHSPDSLGVACNVEQHVEIPIQMGRGVPNFPHFRLGALEGSPCDTLTMTTATKVPVDEDRSIDVYPNPASDYLQLSSATPFLPDSELVLYNPLGEVVSRKRLRMQKEVVFDLALPTGIYFYGIVENGEVIKSGKLVVERG